MFKTRLPYFVAFCITVALGLGSRTPVVPKWIYPHLGDALYATMFYFIIAFCFLRISILKKWMLAVLCCWAIEIFQLYQAPWINEIRATLPGKLILGSGFLWSDMVAYVVGAALGMWIDIWLISRK